jgi:hypothetical protein
MHQHIKVRKSPTILPVTEPKNTTILPVVEHRNRCNAGYMKDIKSNLSKNISYFAKLQASYSDDNEDDIVLSSSDSDADLKTAMSNSLKKMKSENQDDDQFENQDDIQSENQDDDQFENQDDIQSESQDDDQFENQSLRGYVLSDSDDEFEEYVLESDSDTEDLVNKYINMFRKSNLKTSFDGVDIMVYANIMTMTNAHNFEIFKNQFTEDTWDKLINTKYPAETILTNIVQQRMMTYINK